MPLIVANWKMNKTLEESMLFISQLVEKEEEINDNQVVVCPNFLHLHFLNEFIGESETIYLGAQNMYYPETGAYTGETSLLQIQECAEFVIIGHSERRTIFGETNELVAKKVAASSNYDITPIICIGEPLEVKQDNNTEKYLTKQLEEAFSLKKPDQCIIAYEPCWAISDGKTAKKTPTPEEIQTTAEIIKKQYDFPMLYGGSVSQKNAPIFLDCPDIDGLLVGGASLDFDEFWNIIQP